MPGTDKSTSVEDAIVSLIHHLEQAQATKVGFPGAEDLDYSALLPLWNYEINNIGDPYDEPVFAHHTKRFEQEAVDFFADLFGAPADDRWGYVTTGSTESLQYGLLRARQIYPDGIAYYSTAAHYKVPRVLADFRMSSVAIPATATGEMSYPDLHQAIAAHPGLPAIVVATAGTTMTEAVDDLGAIGWVLNDLGVLDRYIHVDAALAGIPLALLPDRDRPRFDFRAGADSLGVSLHKFLATRQPGGIVLTRRSARPGSRHKVPYIGAADTVITGSRNGHLAMMAWYCVRTQGLDGLRRRADEARATAGYLVRRLGAVRWPAWRHKHAFTVVLRTPPRVVLTRWRLATEGEWSHYICLPGRTITQAERFVADLERSRQSAAARAAPPLGPEENGRRVATNAVRYAS